MNFIYLTSGIFTPIALWFYFSPWLYDPHETLGRYMFSVLWFTIAWLFAVMNIDSALKLKRNGRSIWIWHVVAAFVIAACYEGLIIGWYNGYMLTV